MNEPDRPNSTFGECAAAGPDPDRPQRRRLTHRVLDHHNIATATDVARVAPESEPS